MTSVDLGRIGVWGHLDSLTADEARAYARRADELGYGALWVPETVGREPFTLLGMLAGDAGRMALGTSIVSIWGRDAQTARMGMPPVRPDPCDSEIGGILSNVHATCKHRCPDNVLDARACREGSQVCDSNAYC